MAVLISYIIITDSQEKYEWLRSANNMLKALETIKREAANNRDVSEGFAVIEDLATPAIDFAINHT